MSFFRNRRALVLTVVLIAQGLLFHATSRTENIPPHDPLTTFPTVLGDWNLFRDDKIGDDVLDVLKADDTLTRWYVDKKNQSASVFIAYFKSQRTGVSPHSPRNCLPGSGWVPSSAEVLPIDVAGRSTPIEVNRYIVSKGDSKSIVLYWYQTPGRVIASEYSAKVFMVLDAIRYNRTDTALVRVVVPVQESIGEATTTAVDFVQHLFTPLQQFLPA